MQQLLLLGYTLWCPRCTAVTAMIHTIMPIIGMIHTVLPIIVRIRTMMPHTQLSLPWYTLWCLICNSCHWLDIHYGATHSPQKVSLQDTLGLICNSYHCSETHCDAYYCWNTHYGALYTTAITARRHTMVPCIQQPSLLVNTLCCLVYNSCHC